ncbi:DMT family transporter [Candidatus Lokiarchaeum ossiferum]|uniref:DMT family transporter n=1 Tax=Candidatus Lokiarchaeum ossiferum TaxID=2951803 RepID=UPI00352E210D
MVVSNEESLIENKIECHSTTLLVQRKKGILLSVISLLFLGFLPIIANSRPTNLSALSYAFYLSFWELICSLPLLFIELKSHDKGIFTMDIEPPVRKKTYFIMAITGVIFSVSTYFYVFSFEKAGTVSAAIAIQTYPLFSIVWESIFLKKKKRWDELFFTGLIILGIYFIGTEGTFAIHDFSIWFGVALITPFLWSIAHVTIKNTIDQSPISPNQVTFFRVLISSFLLFLLSMFIDGPQSVFGGFTNFEFQKYAFLMGLVYYLELVNWFYAVKYVNVSVASTITTPTPVLTMILAVIFLSEKILVYQIIGMVVVFIALYGLIWRGNKNLEKKNKI